MKYKRIRNKESISHECKGILASILFSMLIHLSCVNKGSMDKDEVNLIFQRIAAHSFNPLNEDFSLTLDHTFKKSRDT